MLSSAHSPSDVEVRALVTPEEISRCVSLYESIFDLGPEDGSLNTRLLVGISRNSGIVVGAYAESELIGFTFSFLANDDSDGTLYQYSQIAAVDSDWQGRGVGRQLKLAQREIALSRGLSQIRWAFDPFQIRNAHFNLDVLGATVHEIVRNLYGEFGTGLDARNASNRVIAVWTLDSPQVHALSGASDAAEATDAEALGTAPTDDGHDGAVLMIPATFHRTLGPTETRRREDALLVMEQLFRDRFEAVSCRQVNAEEAQYAFARRVDV